MQDEDVNYIRTWLRPNLEEQTLPICSVAKVHISSQKRSIALRLFLFPRFEAIRGVRIALRSCAEHVVSIRIDERVDINIIEFELNTFCRWTKPLIPTNTQLLPA